MLLLHVSIIIAVLHAAFQCSAVTKNNMYVYKPVPEENHIQQRMQWNMSAIEIVGVTINSNEDYS